MTLQILLVSKQDCQKRPESITDFSSYEKQLVTSFQRRLKEIGPRDTTVHFHFFLGFIYLDHMAPMGPAGMFMAGLLLLDKKPAVLSQKMDLCMGLCAAGDKKLRICDLLGELCQIHASRFITAMRFFFSSFIPPAGDSYSFLCLSLTAIPFQKR
ncbi:hypothetical protein Y1Q_0008484 [Alligator mississippiensis]|uniref:Uncharacterized protein n=1 Tax=Alligator mississippiensis TaxID=8496 RepID=A0A151M1M4_ALLMI|nr:hypothetical protein Y1Q_0008484 [Alligator mississippiensis]